MDSLDGIRVLRKDEVIRLVGLSASRIRQLEHDGEFPKRFALGARAVGWLARDVVDWIEQRRTTGTYKALRAKKSTREV